MERYKITNKRTKESVLAIIAPCERWEDERLYYIFDNMAFNKFIAFYADKPLPKCYQVELIN